MRWFSCEDICYIVLSITYNTCRAGFFWSEKIFLLDELWRLYLVCMVHDLLHYYLCSHYQNYTFQVNPSKSFLGMEVLHILSEVFSICLVLQVLHIRILYFFFEFLLFCVISLRASSQFSALSIFVWRAFNFLMLLIFWIFPNRS